MLPPWANVWPINWYLTSPASFYISFTFFLSFVLIVPSIIFLRKLAQSTSTLRTWLLEKLHLSKGDRTKKPRNVWSNPIAWREAKTKASAARTSVLRWIFIAAGVAGAFVLAGMFSSVKLPPKYISPGSYDPANNALFINGDATYGLSPDVQVMLGDKAVDANYLSGRYGVSNFQTQLTPRHTKEITAITLSEITRSLSAENVRTLLLGAVVLEFAVILLIVTNAAASTVTREKEDGSLDLLLTTPITSRYYIWGKLRGLVSFVLPLVAVPVLSVAIFVIYDFARMLGSETQFQWIVFPEAVIVMPPMLVIVAAFASILGMQMSLRCRTTVRAVMSSVGIVAGICAVLIGCGQGLLGVSGDDGGLHLILSGFSPFTLLAVLIDPYAVADRTFGVTGHVDVNSARLFMFISAVAATAAYAAVVWMMYKSMVKNFDMTIRRQSR
jgi:ABC-type transport system involved in multi-copper enzyme maturation permease subunit